jgi:hypothetical protein
MSHNMLPSFHWRGEIAICSLYKRHLIPGMFIKPVVTLCIWPCALRHFYFPLLFTPMVDAFNKPVNRRVVLGFIKHNA